MGVCAMELDWLLSCVALWVWQLLTHCTPHLRIGGRWYGRRVLFAIQNAFFLSSQSLLVLPLLLLLMMVQGAEASLPVLHLLPLLLLQNLLSLHFSSPDKQIPLKSSLSRRLSLPPLLRHEARVLLVRNGHVLSKIRL